MAMRGQHTAMPVEQPPLEQIRNIAADLADAADDVERVIYALELDARLSGDLDETQRSVKGIFGSAPDIMIGRVASRDGIEVLVVFNQVLVDRATMVRVVFDRIADTRLAPFMHGPSKTLLQSVAQNIAPTGTSEVVAHMGELATHVLEGSAIVCLPGTVEGLAIQMEQAPKRAISEPTSSPVVIGPHEGFIEDASTNLSLVRRRLRTPRLWVEPFRLGGVSQTTVYLLHLHGIADDLVVQEARRRIGGIRIDGVLDANYVLELIRDAPGLPVPTIMRTERPDKVAAGLLEGQFAVVVDGSPFALLAPITFAHLLKSSEDYYQGWFPSSVLRFFRLAALLMGVLLPGVYTAIVTYHQELIPTPLLIVLASSRENVPLPTIVELLLMMGLFEVIREAGVRVPQGIGSAVTIGGTLVVGQAAVRAGIVSAPIIIVVSGVVISFLAVPDYDLVQISRFLVYPLLVGASILGLFGLLFVALGFALIAASLRSFGVPFLSPLAPMRPRNWKDFLVRVPWWGMNTRPASTGQANPVRQAPNQKPKPPGLRS